jgi:chromosome partitioning protein
MATTVDKVLERYSEVVQTGILLEGGPRYSSYAVSNLRGGVGKSTPHSVP